MRRFIRVALRALRFAVVSLAFLIALLLAATAIDHHRSTALPMPAGHFAVGRTRFDWVDSQSTATAAQTRREVVAWVWYPAERTPDATTTEYLPASWREENSRYSGVLMSRFLTRDLAKVQVHSLNDAPIAKGNATFPVVIFRAGGSALTTSFTSLAEDLASRGYVVVGIDAPYITSFVVLPDNRVVLLRPENNLENYSSFDDRVHLAERLTQMWAANMAFALDQLSALNASDPAGRFTTRLDLQRVGIVGHSLGGASAAQFCHQDDRCKAGIDLDGMVFGPVVQSGLRQPFMFVMSDQDGSDAEGKRALADIQSVYDRTPAEGRFRVKILGTNHFSFSDQVLVKSQVLMGVMHALRVMPTDGRRGLAITEDYVATFLDIHLRGAPADRLRQLEQKYPEVRSS